MKTKKLLSTSLATMMATGAILAGSVADAPSADAAGRSKFCSSLITYKKAAQKRKTSYEKSQYRYQRLGEQSYAQADYLYSEARKFHSPKYNTQRGKAAKKRGASYMMTSAKYFAKVQNEVANIQRADSQWRKYRCV